MLQFRRPRTSFMLACIRRSPQRRPPGGGKSFIGSGGASPGGSGVEATHSVHTGAGSHVHGPRSRAAGWAGGRVVPLPSSSWTCYHHWTILKPQKSKRSIARRPRSHTVITTDSAGAPGSVNSSQLSGALGLSGPVECRRQAPGVRTDAPGDRRPDAATAGAAARVDGSRGAAGPLRSIGEH